MIAEHHTNTPELRWDLIRSIVDVVGTSVRAWNGHVLLACVKLGIIETLAKGGMTVADLARAVQCSERGVERLLIAAHACGILERDGSMYRNGEHAERVLVPGKPGYVGNWMRLMDHWGRAWTHLQDAVRTGRNVEDPHLHLGGNAEYTRDFITGMHDYAAYRGSDILRHLDLTNDHRLIDVGAGPGTYSIMFAQKYPDLTCTVFDLPDVLVHAKRYIKDAQIDRQIITQPGNYHTDDFGDDYDVVFLSDMLHQEDAETSRMILRKAFRALRPGGRGVVQAMFLHDDKSGPEWPALQSLLMLLIYRTGQNHTMAETSEWIEVAGFEPPQRITMSPYNVNSLLVAHKPPAV